MAAFIMHPDRGILEVDKDGVIIGKAVVEPVSAEPERAPVERYKSSTLPAKVQSKSITVPAASAESLSPRDVIRLAKRRKKEIDAELKQVRAKLKNLEREKLQIDALVKAADSAHLAVVRPINNRRTG